MSRSFSAHRSSLIAHSFTWLTCAALLVGLHAPYLLLPYYWDEAGYYVPAAWELAQHGRLIPRTTAANPHPPFLSLYLAAAWKLFGFHPLVTRLAMALVAAAAVYTLLLLATELLPASGGLWAAVLLGASPIFFAQSTLVHLDVAATAFTLLTLHFFLRGRMVACLVAATALCLTRETGAVVVLVLIFWKWRAQRAVPLLALSLLPLLAWFVFLRATTGHWLGNPAFAAYNVEQALHPARFLVTLLRRFYFLFLGDFRWVLSLGLLWRLRRPGPLPTAYCLLLTVLFAQTLVVTIFGGAILNRYLLPALALFYLLAVEAWWRWRASWRPWALAAVLAVHVGGWFWNPPYPFPYEENLAYADFVRLHQLAAARATLFQPGTRVLTAWPATDELARPELGYVARPFRVVALDDFSEEAFARVKTEDFDVLLLYSREWQPSWNLLEKWPLLDRLGRRLYGRRPQATPEWVRGHFGLVTTGSARLSGQWVEWMEKAPPQPVLAGALRKADSPGFRR